MRRRQRCKHENVDGGSVSGSEGTRLDDEYVDYKYTKDFILHCRKCGRQSSVTIVTYKKVRSPLPQRRGDVT